MRSVWKERLDRWGLNALSTLIVSQLIATVLIFAGLALWLILDPIAVLNLVDWPSALILWGALAVFNGAVWVAGRRAKR